MTPARLVIDVSEDEVDATSGRLWSLGTTGIEEATTEQLHVTRLYAGFDSVSAAESARLEIRVGEVVPVTSDEWLDTWRDHARVVRAGNRFVVKPAWLDHTTIADDIVIDLDPGRSFGSGSHPTTRLALAAIERAVVPGARVLDVGCGSGVLAIGAALVGAAHVTALDPDPEAVAATTSNAARNGVCEIVDVRSGSIDPDMDGARDVVVANILATVLLDIAPQLIASCAPTGTVIVSGMLDRQADEIAAAFSPFVEVERHVEERWVAATFTRSVAG